MKQPFQCNLQPTIQEPHGTTHTGTTTRYKKKKGGTIRVQKDRSRNPRTDEVPFIAGCSHFTRKNTRFRAPASSPTHHLPSSPLPFVTTSLCHHFPLSPLPFVTTSLRHHSVIISTLHQGQFHRFFIFCYVLLYDLPPFIISSLRILFVRNTEILLPNFL